MKELSHSTEIYDYKFSNKSKLTAHIESVHEGIKPFKCDICDYKFSNKSKLIANIESQIKYLWGFFPS